MWKPAFHFFESPKNEGCIWVEVGRRFDMYSMCHMGQIEESTWETKTIPNFIVFLHIIKSHNKFHQIQPA